MGLAAPTCGSLEGILFYQDPGIGTGKSSSSLSGSTSSTLEGAMYFPTTSLTYSGFADSKYLAVVANTITLSGSATIPDDYSGLCNAGPLAPPVAVSVMPTTATLTGGLSQQFTATVTNANPSETGVTWSISPSGAGSIDSSGLYTAPATITTEQTVTVTATSQADNTKSSSATVTLLPPVVPMITWITPAAITYGTPLSAEQLDATVNAPGMIVYSPAAGTVLSAGTQTLTATFTPANPTLYTPAVASVELVVNKASPSITWAAPAGITYGTALSGAQLDATASTPGTFVYTPAVGAVLTAGSQSLSATFTPTDTTDYTTATASTTLTVNQAAPTITWPTPATISYGTALGSAQLDATANVPGTFVYSPAAGTVLTGGSQTLSVTFTPTDTADYSTATASVVQAVSQAIPTITWATPAAITYGTALSATQLDATANVPGTFAYTPAAGTVLSAGSQTLSVTFTPTDTTDYTTATSTVTLTVNLSISVSVSPTSATLNAGQTQQFTATVTNTGNTAVTWSISPATAGSINVSGLYSAPATISSQETVTITATSQVDNSTAGSASVTLAPAQCTSSAYNYVREITIDHTKVPNTDQTNFPFLFNTTDPLLATINNGGHVANPNGYDIIFATDPAGQNQLNYEIEKYDPTTGHLIAWVKLPTLSHTSDTILYLLYGNANISASQQNPTAVWDAKYMGVWHVPNGAQLSLADSTSYANNATGNGAIATTGQIDGGMSTNGSTYATIGTPANLANLAQGTATFSAWVNPSVNGSGGIIMGKDDEDRSSGWELGLNRSNYVAFSVIFDQQDFQLVSSQPVPSGSWSYVVVALTGSSTQSQATIYINGVPSGTGSGGVAQTGDDSAQDAYLANANYGFGEWAPFNGATDEFRISNTLRSADWIAAEYANQSAPQTFYNLATENISIDPLLTTLYGGQTQQFAASILNNCSGVISWSISPAGVGTITTSGLYTAPGTINTQQTVTITANSASDPATSASAIVTLMPPLAVTVTPSTLTISNGYQQQQFTATVTNATDSGVTWTVSPSGVGNIDANGVYTAPPTIQAQQTVTITATSRADATKAGSATITLTPPALPPPTCASNGYSFERVIVIDHTKVPNTDQVNFPFLFNTTDPGLAITDNGGHVANASGYDIMFSTDPAGQVPLDYEIEKYNPVTGQLIAWIRIPTVSHTTDTVLYMFYGNASISASQQNPSGVWDTNYVGVWHVPNGTQLSLADSTSYANNATGNGAIATTGQIDGGMSTNGSTYATIGTPASLANLAQSNATFSAWVNPSVNGGGGIIMGKDDGDVSSGWTLGLDYNNNVEFSVVFDDYDFQLVSSQAVPSNEWSYVVVALTGSSTLAQATIYINGIPSGSGSGGSAQTGDDSAQIAYLANSTYGYEAGSPLNGSLDEFRISKSLRSADWIATEYANQASLSTFYSLYPENTVEVAPSVAALSASQTEQFIIVGACNTPPVNWSMPAGSPGTLTSGGLFTAPASIDSQQTITINAESQADGSTVGSAVLTLLPPITVSVNPQNATVGGGQTAQFTATVSNADNTGVTWSLSPAGIGTINVAGQYTAPVVFSSEAVTITATSVADPTKSASTTVTLIPYVTVAVTPASVTLSAGQTVQFDSSISGPGGGCGGAGGCTTWSISPSGAGSIVSSGVNPGFYTAPTTISTQQIVTVTATGQFDGVTATGTAIITLILPAVSVSPQTVTLYGGQTEQFFATVMNSPNEGVTWSISPSGVGTLSASGLYAAPPIITSQQSITITATSQAVPSISATAVLSLSPTQCPAKAYGYVRAITIDHTKVPNSDQVNFPFFFTVTDPLLASTAYGGHVASTRGDDIVFSTDSAGLHTLDYELESYNPAIGKVTAWIRVPTLSHTSDTVLYMFYGNSSITAPQQNPSGVWDSTYSGVYQFDNIQPGVIGDLTANGHNGVPLSVQEVSGETGAAGSFDGATSYLTLPEADFPSFPFGGSSAPLFDATFEVWFKTSTNGVILGQTSGGSVGGSPGNGWVPALYVGTDGKLRASFFSLSNVQQIVSSASYNDNNWHHAVLAFDTNAVVNDVIAIYGTSSTTSGTETLYVDGRIVGTARGGVENGYSSFYSYFAGTGYTSGWASTNENWSYFGGDLGQIEISTVARSSDWVQAEYVNQSSPSTFFTLGSEVSGNGSVNPGSVTLYGAQSQQFTIVATGMCNAADAIWSMPSGSPGTLSATGIYTAPASIGTQQSLTITGTTLGSSSAPLAATVTLMPSVTVNVAPGTATLIAGETQRFTANVSNTNNTGVTWAITPAGVGSINSTGVYTAPATITAQETMNVTATSIADPTQSASATITLSIGAVAPQVSVSLNPPTALLFANQTTQFTAAVANTDDQDITWSISPAGTGTIGASGLYTAPATVSSQQTVTIVATSQADPTQSSSATVFLESPCASNGYGYARAIVIDHTKVPNTDQTNFPFLFNTTDPLLATTANGGHVANPNGYDIIFATDPAGQNQLNYETEEYNPTNGHLIAWVKIPTLSHTSDTVLYILYGNSSITTPQQNPAGVWDNTFAAVYHLPNGTTLSANDSTSNGNNGTNGGASAATGELDGAASFNGSSDIDIGIAPSLQVQSMTLSAWINPADNNSMRAIFGGTGGSDGYYEFRDSSSNTLQLLQQGVAGIAVTSATVTPGTWSYVAVTYDGSGNYVFYINGVPAGSVTNPQRFTYGTDHETIGKGYSNQEYFSGSIDEARIANVARSADWIAAEYNNQSSPSTFYSLYGESSQTVTPASVTLYAGQSQQFVANGLCGSGVTWSMPEGSLGELTDGGLYTAPAVVTAEQSITITAAGQGESGQSFTATVTLMPPVGMTISPASLTLGANQSQQFAATVTNSSDPTVIWSVSPVGLGTIDQTGSYLAPSSIATQQTVTITATSQADPTKFASAMITLAPLQCASSGYGYQRIIVIDHTKVANSDQTNFPFLFNTTDPDMASIGHGGHVASENGYDIIFSTDPSGRTKLDHEIEEYNPATGQLVAWIRVPTLSHTADTVIYVFYGNPDITVSQANSMGVWDPNYEAVYHLGDLSTFGVAKDSTTNDNNAGVTSFTPGPGQIDGAASLDGTASYMVIPSTAFPSYPTGVYTNLGVNTTWNTNFSATYGIWFKTTSWGGLLDQTAGETCTFFLFVQCDSYGPEQPGDTPNGSWRSMLDLNFNGNLEGPGGSTAQALNDDKWHYAVVTFDDGVDKLYADGKLIGTSVGGDIPYAANYAYFVGTEDVETDNSSLDERPWQYLPGQIDEVTVSNSARSGDWIQTEYNNQSSPSTFYSFYPASEIQVVPSAVSLYAGQTQQFSVPGTCDAGINWSMPGGSLGTLSADGLYTSPDTISSQQTITVSATSQSNGATIGSAQVTLLAPPKPISLAASDPPPYQTGSSQTFVATMLDPYGNAETGINVTFSVVGTNGTAETATTDDNGNASFTYAGTNNGTDAIQATGNLNGQLLASNTVTATWITPPPIPVATVALLPQPSPGRGALMGAFTDSSGNLIEPIVIGTTAKSFITPANATQLQLGISDTYYEDNGGSGFTVMVNGATVTVPSTAMPWKWKIGGLNNNYQYGVNDGTAPVIAATGLSAGESIAVAYQGGTISTAYPARPSVNANGETAYITGTQLDTGAYYPTLYTTGTSYPQGQPITVSAVVTDATGIPIPNAQVTLDVAGANPGQYQATSDSTGIATFLYTGSYAGTDTLQAQAVTTGQGTLLSNQTALTWTNYPTPPAVGSLTLTYLLTIVDQQRFVSYAKDASGNPLPNVNVGYYISGVDNFQVSGYTSDTGEASMAYNHTVGGNYKIVAVDSVGRNVIITQPYTGTWTVPTNSSSGGSSSISIDISTSNYVTIPNPLQLNGTVTDNSGLTPTITWSEVSGPGTVTFANPNQAVTTATFSGIGTYVLQLSASDTLNSASGQITVTVVQSSTASETQGFIGSPVYGAQVSGIVPITLASGVSLASGTLTYIPTNNPNDVTVLNANVSGTGQIGTLDTTALQNGSYWIQMEATDTSGKPAYDLVLLTVAGNYKPGRVTTTVTDLVVPSNGLPIQIQRTYDSLKAGESSDFGYGWSLGINVDLVVGPSGNVTFTLGGQRRTYYLTPKPPPCTLVGCLWPFYNVAFTPEPGLHGALTDSSGSCGEAVVPNGSLWECYLGGGQYDPSGYIYTDPSGTEYTISAGGALQSIVDRNGNGLTIGYNGITSTTGLNVPFVRDSQGRITQIADPQGNVYEYGYDENGNLATVTYPNTTQPSTYTYDANHDYLSGTDFRNNPLPSTAYYAAGDTDAEGNPLAGKLKSVTDGLGEITTYAYDLTTNTTTVNYPPDAGGNQGTETLVYDSYGDLISDTDPLGHVTANTYDANHNLVSTVDPVNQGVSGEGTAYTYDANGNRTSVSYPKTATSTNTTSTTSYNQYSEPTQTVDELGNARTFNYDANFNPRSVTDSLGTLASFIFNANGTLAAGAAGYDIGVDPSKASQFSYDAVGNLVGHTDALGRTTSYGYNSLGQKTSMTAPPQTAGGTGATTGYQYDAFGNLTETDAPLGRATKSQYDGDGNKISDIDALGNVTGNQYDALNRLVETDYPDGTKATKSYDFRGNVIDSKVLDASGKVVQYTHSVYDLAGRLSLVTFAYGTADATTLSYTYDADGRKLSETDALGHVTSYTYDAAGNLLSVSGVKGNFTYTYDNARDHVSMTDGDNNKTGYVYDVRKRLVETDYPDGTKKTNAYDGPGNLTLDTDQAGNQVQYSYDAANQLANVAELNSPNTGQNTTIYGYDGDGNPITFEDANTHTTSQSFDLLNELSTTSLPDGSLTETRTYDSNGNLKTVVHFNGVMTTYTYDSLNRLLSRATPGEPTVSFTYTATGKRATMTDASGTTTYSYDYMDRLSSKQTPEGTLTYTYDAVGNPASIASSNANGASMSYTYDDLNRLSTEMDKLGTTTYTYDGESNLYTATYPNAVQAQYSYDPLNRISGLATQQSGYTYQRGSTGNLTHASELNGRSVTFSFDGIYRLTTEAITGDPVAQNNGSVGYDLDPVGNRSSDTSSLTEVPVGSWNYNADDELSDESYDQDGNVTHSGANQFSYDSQNELVSMNGGAVQMLYDGDGNRVATAVTSGGVTTTTYYLVDDLNPTGLPQVMDELTNGVVTRTYMYGLQRISEDQIVNGAWTPSFYSYDGMGSVRQLTSMTGAVTDSYEYDAFGNEISHTGTTPNNYLYRGEQLDPDLGLYYLRARYYNPITGRFMSRDPGLGDSGEPRTLHKYLYADANPVDRIDPTGRAAYAENLNLTTRVLATTSNLLGFGLRVACWYNTLASGVRLLTGPSLLRLVGFGLDFASCKAFGEEGPGDLGSGGSGGGGGGGPPGPSGPPPLPPPPSKLIYVIGREPDVIRFMEAHGTEGYRYLINVPNWSIPMNREFIQQGIDGGNYFELASPISEQRLLNPRNPNGFAIFAGELAQLFGAGYTWPGSGEFLIPPGQ